MQSRPTHTHVGAASPSNSTATASLRSRGVLPSTPTAPRASIAAQVRGLRTQARTTPARTLIQPNTTTLFAQYATPPTVAAPGAESFTVGVAPPPRKRETPMQRRHRVAGSSHTPAARSGRTPFTPRTPRPQPTMPPPTASFSSPSFKRHVVNSQSTGTSLQAIPTAAAVARQRIEQRAMAADRRRRERQCFAHIETFVHAQQWQAALAAIENALTFFSTSSSLRHMREAVRHRLAADAAMHDARLAQEEEARTPSRMQEK